MAEAENILDEFQKLFFKIKNNKNQFRDVTHKESTLIIGPTGVGKTTLAKVLFTDNKKLKSIYVCEGVEDYIIQDDECEIYGGISSTTITPKVYYDDHMVYYDCPGFSDNRSPLSDISGAAFIKHVVDNSDRIRLVIVINYSWVKTGNDKVSFLSFIKHIVEFVKNIETVKNSIILVITKVNKYLNETDLTKDGLLYTELCFFLENVLKFVVGKLNNASGEEEYLLRQQIKFIEILLNEKKRIIFFKQPDQPGIIENVKLIQINKTVAKRALAETPLTDIDKTDIGFTIADSTKIHVVQLVQKIEIKIGSDVETIIDDILDHYQNKIKKINYIVQARDTLIGYQQELCCLINNISNSKMYSDSINYILNYLEGLCLEKNAEVLKKILMKYEFIKLLECLHIKKFKNKPLIWTEKLNIILTKIDELLFNFKFLEEFYQTLQKFDTYKLFKDINQPDDASATVLNIIRTKIMNFPNLSSTIEDNDCLKTHFDNITKEIFNRYIETDDTKLIARGNYICLSQIKNLYVPNKIREIIIYAFNVFFIDDDLSKDNLRNVVIISPKWEVVSRRTFNLKGNPGMEPVQVKAAVGKNGKPGLPGESGCSFMGIAKFVTNVNNLTIDISGGNGGRGQDGGNGYPGKDSVVEIPENYSSYEAGKKVLKKSAHEKVKDDVEESRDWWWNYLLSKKTFESSTYHLKKKEASPGGDGYMAGKGGMGGFAGDCILFVESQENGSLKIRQDSGVPGSNGQPGKGGIGGEHGKSYNITYGEDNIYVLGLFKIPSGNARWLIENVVDNGRAEAGNVNTNLNQEGLIPPNNKYVIDTPWAYSNQYRQYALDFCKTNNYQFEHFLNYIESNIPFSSM